ncbi:MAG TPA: fused response regulator/phosphatase, partial [Acidimicrobiales bacterium]|nr:fused response regulator/phosphatase [Acidimicrobiales bacterium]
MIEVLVDEGSADASVRILLVEDDPGDALLTREMLARSAFSFEVEPVTDLAGALARLQGGVECVLLDLGLPDVGGLEALDEILSAAPAAAVIVLTGRADRDLALAAMARGAQDYLKKGELDADLLSRSVRYAVQRKRSEEGARQLLANELLAAESARLERGLLARPIMGTSGWRSAARYRSGGGSLLLGGDFYDAIELPDGTMRVLIGDVSGHGPDEAAIGVALRIAWRGFVLAGVEGDRVLPNVQAVLEAERLSETMFATACDATISADRSSVALRLAGHPPPLLMAESARQLDVEPGLPLGIFGSPPWAATVVPLPEHWALIFYTDGIIEGMAAGSTRARLGTNGLVR